MSSPAVEAVSHLNPDQVTADLNAVADYANKIPASNGKLFVAGFCWGGGQSFRFATHRADLAAAFVFYGPPPAKEAMAGITAPVYGFYAGNDARIGATLPDTREQMKAAGKTFEPVTYEGAGHGFMRAGEAPDASDANRQARTMLGRDGRSCWEQSIAALSSGWRVGAGARVRVDGRFGKARPAQCLPVPTPAGISRARQWWWRAGARWPAPHLLAPPRGGIRATAPACKGRFPCHPETPLDKTPAGAGVAPPPAPYVAAVVRLSMK